MPLALLASAGVIGTHAPVAHAAVGATIELAGHGYGHGRGMGQWGAFGYATEHGYSYDQILQTYYGGTTLGTQPDEPITVHLTTQGDGPLKVTSGRDFAVGGIPVPADTAARIVARPDGSLELSTSDGCDGADQGATSLSSARITSSVADPGDDLSAMLSICTPDGTRQYRGELSTFYADGAQRTVNIVGVEAYLRGVVPRESPASWADAADGRGMEALKAQAIAARSYALAETRATWADTCDTAACQVYAGAGAGDARFEDPRSDAAVAGTAGQVLRTPSGATARAEFSSSTGGHTAGGGFPAVADLGDSVSPFHDWTTSLASADVAAAFDVGTLLDFRITQRNGLGADGGRVLSVVLEGTSGTVTVTGNEIRSRLGLRSDWFTVASA
jgi:SpoIID/LytB domain protein